MSKAKYKREIFPIGNKGFVAFDDVYKTIRMGSDISAYIDDRQAVLPFTDSQTASEAMNVLWELYDEEQLYRAESDE